MSNPNTIDYSNLNTTLKTKRPIGFIRERTAEEIGKVLLGKIKDKTTKQQRLDTLSDQLKWWSESMKIKLAIAVDCLIEQWLLGTDSIKWMTIDDIKKIEWSNSDAKIDNIIKYFMDTWRKDGKELTNDQRKKINKAIIDWLNKHYWDLAEKEDHSQELETRNQELEEELNASEAVNEVVESAVLKRWSKNNMIRVGKAIEKINEDSWLDAVTKARKVLWQANNFAISGSGKRFDWINKLPRKIDVNKEYKDAADNLNKKMDSTKDPKEKVAIRYIMRQINRAYTEYVNATNISEEDRRRNMREINSKMAA